MNPRTRRELIHWGAILLLGGAAIAAVVLWAMARNTTPGEEIGWIDLRAPDGMLRVELDAGDALHTRIDGVFVPTERGKNASELVLSTQLRGSRLTVQLADPSGATTERGCAVYDGSGRLVERTPTSIERSMVNACVVTAQTTGLHTVRANVTWDPGVQVQRARLAVWIVRTR